MIYKYDEIFDAEDIVIENEKINKKTIKTIYKPKYKNNKIYQPLKKYLEAMPEERLRKEFICKLMNDR